MVWAAVALTHRSLPALTPCLVARPVLSACPTLWGWVGLRQFWVGGWAGTPPPPWLRMGLLVAQPKVLTPVQIAALIGGILRAVRALCTQFVQDHTQAAQ